jgi:hypothetical protein
MERPDDYVFDSSEALVESMLGRQLLAGQENYLMNAARRWLRANDCAREPHARGRGRYLVPANFASRVQVGCWPQIKGLALR